jgi:hypothetical protein
MKRKTTEFIHEGKYAAEIPIELIEEEGGWSPSFSLEDAKKLETVRLALRRGDVATAVNMAGCSNCYRFQPKAADNSFISSRLRNASGER